MDSDKCKVLLTVLEEKSLTKAAEKLGYTASGVSRLIGSLEKEAGFPLLIRSRQGMAPTRECLSLLPTLKKINYYSHQYRQSIDMLQGLQAGEIRIGIAYQSYYNWLAGIVSDFLKKYPGIKIDLITKNSSILYEALLAYDIDICLLSKRSEDTGWIPLIDNPIVAWLPKDHPAASGSSFPIANFEFEDYIATYPDEDTDNTRLLSSYGILPNTKFSSTDSYATFCMVEAGLGIALENGLIAEGWQGNVVVKPLDPPSTVSLGIAHLSEKVMSPAVALFIKFMKSYV